MIKSLLKKAYSSVRVQSFSPVPNSRIKVLYTADLEGGGTTFGQDFFKIFNQLNLSPKGNILEWCSGPGFIAFSILEHFSKSLTSMDLIDINRKAVLMAKLTIRKHRLHNVRARQSETIIFPREQKIYNLIIANPPHFQSKLLQFEKHKNQIRFYDFGWKAHKRFLNEVVSIMDSDSILILQENNKGSTCSEFSAMVSEASNKNTQLLVERVIGCAGRMTSYDNFYYIVLRKK
jgi:methylase of polypeptide subunit release factors